MRIGLLLQAVGGHVGEGIAAQVAQALGDQEQNDRPADEEADGVDQAVIAGGVDQRGDPEERGGGHEVAGDRQAVLEAGDVAACGVVVLAGAHAFGRPVGDVQGGADKQDKHHDRLDVHRLALHLAGDGVGMGQTGQQQQRGGGKRGSTKRFMMLLPLAVPLW